MAYAEEGGLEAWQQEIKGADWDQAFRVQTMLSSFEIGHIEPFGFADGVSQPEARLATAPCRARRSVRITST